MRLLTAHGCSQRMAAHCGRRLSAHPACCLTQRVRDACACAQAFRSPRYDFGLIDEPLRIACDDPTLLALATPQRFELVDFAAGAPAPQPVDCGFEVTSEAMQGNERVFREALVAKGVDGKAAAEHAAGAARGLSGVAFWPRLVLRSAGMSGGAVYVDSRGSRSGGASAAPGKSSWCTTLPLLHALPVRVAAGQRVTTRYEIELPEDATEPVWYTLEFT